MANILLRPQPPGRSSRQLHRPSLTSFEAGEANMPPPPYADSRVDKSFDTTSRDEFDLSGLDHSVLESKSKEELSSLLLQASSTLSTRQNGEFIYCF